MLLRMYCVYCVFCVPCVCSACAARPACCIECCVNVFGIVIVYIEDKKCMIPIQTRAEG